MLGSDSRAPLSGHHRVAPASARGADQLECRWLPDGEALAGAVGRCCREAAAPVWSTLGSGSVPGLTLTPFLAFAAPPPRPSTAQAADTGTRVDRSGKLTPGRCWDRTPAHPGSQAPTAHHRRRVTSMWPPVSTDRKS